MKLRLRQTIDAVKALKKSDATFFLGVFAPRTTAARSALFNECGACGARRGSHSALHMRHAQRRITSKRWRRLAEQGTTDLTDRRTIHRWSGYSFQPCGFYPLWAVLLGLTSYEQRSMPEEASWNPEWRTGRLGRLDL